MHKDDTSFIDYGKPVSVAEERTAVMCVNLQRDSRFVIAAKGFVVIVNLDSGYTKQVFFPGNNVEYPFSSYSSNGLFYTGAGTTFMVLDPFTERFIFHTDIENGEEIVGFSFAEDGARNIYFTSYPHCHLLRYSPDTKEMVDYGSMDPLEKYPGSVAIDQNGWAYIGVGTERKNLVAFHLEKGIKKNLFPDALRKKGAGYVYLGKDGSVYGHMESSDLKDVTTSSRWMKFSNGGFHYIESRELSPSNFSGTGFQKIHCNQEASYRVKSYSLSEGFVHVVHKETGQSKTIVFSYLSEGAKLSTICLGPDGHLYGTSMHPLHLFQFDFATNKITNFGGQVIEKGGGGNIAAYASDGRLLIGAAYAGGKLYVFDTTKTFINRENPKLVLQEESIHRPRCAIALKDKKQIMWGGYPGYGMVGGSLGIFHLETEQHQLLSHENVVANQSTVSLGELRSGDILGGTSIETPGGAESREKEACLYVLDWHTKTVKDRFFPIKGTREISLMYVDSFDRAHCLTEQSVYFVCNPYTQKILYRRDLSSLGKIVRDGFVYELSTNTLYCLLSSTLLKMEICEEKCLEPKIVQSLPLEASSGVVLYERRIFYGSGSHLCSIHTDME